MKAWMIDRYGGPEVLRLGDAPEPEVRPGDVLIAVRAASVNPIDWKLRAGDTRRVLPLPMPIVMGNDVAGEVIECGRDVSTFSPGDAVFARPHKLRIGAFAERIAVDASEVARAPSSVDIVQAASLPLAGLTAYQALTELANVGPGQRVLIQAGAGGVGTLAIQLASHLGAFVATTASAAKHELLRGLGADQPICYRTQDYTELLSDIDFVLDSVGGAELARGMSVLRPGGLAVSLVGPPDPPFAAEWKLPLPVRVAVRLLSLSTRRRARRMGVRYRFWFMRSDGVQLGELARLVDAGTIRPVIDREFGFEEVDAALAYAEDGHATGKVVIRVGG